MNWRRGATAAPQRTPSGPRVGFFGLFGQGNLGNDGSLESVIAYLKARHPDAILDLRCSDPDQMAVQFGLPATRLRRYHWEQQASGRTKLAQKGLKTASGMIADAFRTGTWVRQHDVVIVPGMGVLEATLPIRSWHMPYSMFLLCAFGKLFGTKVALVSVGANVINQPLTRRLVTSAARLAYYRSYRDNVSKDAMQRMGLDTTGDRVYPDLAFFLPTPLGATVVAGMVGVGIMNYSGGNDDRQQADELRAAYIEKMKRFVLWLVDNGRQVRLFTTDVHDERVLQDVLTDVRVRRPDLDPAQIAAESVSSLDALMRKLAPVSIVVASRYHNVLCALKLAKPTISVGYAAKFDELMAGMGLAGFSQAASALDVTRLIEQFTELESRAAQFRQAMMERNEANLEALDRQFVTLSALLFQVTGTDVPVAGTGALAQANVRRNES